MGEGGCEFLRYRAVPDKSDKGKGGDEPGEKGCGVARDPFYEPSYVGLRHNENP